MSGGAIAFTGDGGSTTEGRVTVLRGTSCKTCRVIAESVAYLGHPDDTLALGDDNIPARDSRGRFYLLTMDGSSILVFGPDGRLMTTFGRSGHGPGEMAGIKGIFVSVGDTLFVVGGGFVHVLSPDYLHQRQYRHTTDHVDDLESAILPDRRLLVGGTHHHFALMDSTGALSPTVALQDIDTAACGDCGSRTYRAGNTPGTLWSGPLNAYRVEQHDLTGRLLQRFVRETEWFPPWGPAEIKAETFVESFARPQLLGVRQGTDGIVWTHVTMIEHADDLKGINPDHPAEMVRFFSRAITRIEAIDPEAKVLLAGTTLPYLTIPLTNDYSAQLNVNDSGDWSWKIFRFRIEGRNP